MSSTIIVGNLYLIFNMIDTHCHLNFSRFKGKVPAVLERARNAGVRSFIVPGTDTATSCAAISLAQQEPDVYAAVGIHPHHAFEQGFGEHMDRGISEIRSLLQNRNAVAVGEVGLDRFEYTHTKYEGYAVDSGFMAVQKELLRRQLEIAREFGRAVILHNREAVEDMLELLNESRDIVSGLQMVFHCCEPDKRLLRFAIEHGIFIGVDGDVTYTRIKLHLQKKFPLTCWFLRRIPLTCCPNRLEAGRNSRTSRRPLPLFRNTLRRSGIRRLKPFGRGLPIMP
jgi:TatD DNase family protein